MMKEKEETKMEMGKDYSTLMSFVLSEFRDLRVSRLVLNFYPLKFLGLFP